MTFDAIKIGLASPEKILEWSKGEVTKPETINYRTLKPEKDGLFCEKIFGPSKDWECHCGKYKKIRYKGVVCDRCGVEVTKASVRRERMGHIALAAPVSHIWYFKGIPSRMGLILDLSPRTLERVLYFASYIVLDKGESDLMYKQVLSEAEYQEAREKWGSAFRVGMGAESIKELLENIDLEKEYTELTEGLKGATGQKRARIVKRLEVVEAFRESGNKPEWMIMTNIPVIPPDLRPMVQLDGGRFATSDLNDLYRRIINRNNRLRRLLELGAPDIIVRNEKRMLQEAVDALIDNGRRGRPVTGPGNRALKSLSDMLKGKSGRFRQNLLGKRVDYSGRSVICVEPKLKIYQCGLPKEMAIELFKPFVMKELAANGTAHNIKSAKKMVERLQPEVWDVLEDVIKEHPVMLNRAPTLHRLGIQAFEPILVEGKAIKLHPLVCTAFNADFDGDQMAVHLPLTAEAQAECRFMLLSPNNLLKPSDGGLVAVPSQDMILGVYYLTMRKLADYKDDPKMVAQVSSDTVYNDIEELRKLTTPDENTGKAELGLYDLIWFEDVTDGNRRVLCRPIDLLGRYYGSVNLAMLAYENKEITLHQNIFVHRTVKLPDGTEVSGFTETTVGLLIFNENIPQDLGFIDRSKAENALKFEVEFHVGKKQIKQILEKVINTHGATTTAEVLDNVKAMGYKYSTQAAMTVSISDMTVPPQKPQMIEQAQNTVDRITRQYKRGLITEEERYKEVVETWKETDDELTTALLTGLDKYNNIFMMADSGARGSDKQIKQLAGMRGLMADTTGRTIELPIKSNFREGLDVLEYFMSAHGARKGMSDTALRTADSGYLTRRMVDVSQDVIIREQDCGVTHGIKVSRISENGQVIEKFSDRVRGRYLVGDVVDAATGEVLIPNTKMMMEDDAKLMETRAWVQKNPRQGDECRFDPAKDEYPTVMIRTVLTCKAHSGVCAKCYGMNLATQQPVGPGEAVGIIAAQSIGEPGTQLTMRTFHTGGVAGGDITQGLPRVEELFEARRPKKMATLAEIGGKVRFEEATKGSLLNIIVTADDGDNRIYSVPHTGLRVNDGDVIAKGTQLQDGALSPHDILRIRGTSAVHDYLIQEVLKVYRQQGVDINDKHIEVIVRQMMRKVRVEESGDTNLLSGSMVDLLEYEDANEEIRARNAAGEVNAETGEPLQEAIATQLLMGITKASLATDSWMSAASFQETTKVLTEAAIKGKVDHLVGLKENVIIGKLIPAGTRLPEVEEELVQAEIARDAAEAAYDH